MSKHVGLTSSISSEDLYPRYDFFVYEDPEGNIIVMTSESYEWMHKLKKPKLSLDQMDQMTEEEINEWYESHDRSHISD